MRAWSAAPSFDQAQSYRDLELRRDDDNSKEASRARGSPLAKRFRVACQLADLNNQL
jgi:hypothetical protein